MQGVCRAGAGLFPVLYQDHMVRSRRLLLQPCLGPCRLVLTLEIVEGRGGNLEVPCQAHLWTPSPHPQLLQGFTLLCPRVPSSHPLPLSDLEDPVLCPLATPLRTPWTHQPQPEALRTRDLQGRGRQSRSAPALVPLPPPPPSSRQTPSGTTPQPAPWTPISCNPWDILKPQLISAICLMMEHLHYDCCI